jgi:Zn finger protein HypA/HybF involved in hydrogenase expression
MDQYRCPKCGSDRLKVVVQVWAKLTQQPEEDNVQTEFEGGDMEFDGDSPMMCEACGEEGTTDDFVVGREPSPATRTLDEYKCPKCGSEDLNVLAEVWGLLHQEPQFKVFGVESIEGESPDFDDRSTMECNTCGESGVAKIFLIRTNLEDIEPEVPHG